MWSYIKLAFIDKKSGDLHIKKADPFLKNQNGACLWISSLKFYTDFFYCMPS